MSLSYGTDEWEKEYQKLAEERLASQPKPYIMGTPEWVATFEKKIKADDKYKKLAKKWEGSVVIHILAKPDLGLEEDLYLYLDLWHGDCRFVRLVPREVGVKGNYVLTGEFERWKSVMKGDLDPIKGLMQGKIKLKGSLTTMVRYVKAASRLVSIATEIDTKFPDELDAEELEEFKNWLREIRPKYGI